MPIPRCMKPRERRRGSFCSGSLVSDQRGRPYRSGGRLGQLGCGRSAAAAKNRVSPGLVAAVGGPAAMDPSQDPVRHEMSSSRHREWPGLARGLQRYRALREGWSARMWMKPPHDGLRCGKTQGPAAPASPARAPQESLTAPPSWTYRTCWSARKTAFIARLGRRFCGRSRAAKWWGSRPEQIKAALAVCQFARRSENSPLSAVLHRGLWRQPRNQAPVPVRREFHLS
jgi:hypothetical protein